MKTNVTIFLPYSRRQEVKARKVDKAEIVQCYNGHRLAEVGDYVVLDEEDRVMIIRGTKFERHFQLMEEINDPIQERDESRQSN